MLRRKKEIERPVTQTNKIQIKCGRERKRKRDKENQHTCKMSGWEEKE